MEREANEVRLSLAASDRVGNKTVVVVVVNQDLYLRKEMKHAGQTGHSLELCSSNNWFTMINISKIAINSR